MQGSPSLFCPCALLAKLKRLSRPFHAVQGRGELMHYQYVLCPEPCRPTFRNAAAMFLCSFAFFWESGLSAFCLAKNTLIKIILGAAHISNPCPLPEARALAGWISYSQSPQLVRPSLEPQDCVPFQAPRRHCVPVFEEPLFGFSSQATITKTLREIRVHHRTPRLPGNNPPDMVRRRNNSNLR
jgi:hypothetical protein